MVVAILSDDDVHHAERERGIGARVDGQVLVRQARCLGTMRVDHDETRSLTARLDNERPQVHVRGKHVGAPGDDQLGFCKLFGLRCVAKA